MPGLDENDFDERIAAALRETAREPEGNSVLRTVHHKRRVRQQRRRTGAVAFTVVAVLAVGGVTTALVRSGDNDSGGADIATDESTTTTSEPASRPADPVKAKQDIATDIAPGPVTFTGSTEAVVTVDGIGVRIEERDGEWQINAASQCQLDADTSEDCTRLRPDVSVHDGAITLDAKAYRGGRARVRPLTVDGIDGYVREPITERAQGADNGFSVALYDRVGPGYVFPPSHLVPIDDPTGGTDLRGKILSLANGNDVTWAVTEEKNIDSDGIAYRLKRIKADGSFTSAAIPAGELPVGRVVAGAGFTWVPVRSGVLRYDTATGNHVDMIELAPQGSRAVAIVGDQVLVTDGNAITTIEGGQITTSGNSISADLLVDLVAVDDTTLWALSGTEAVRLDDRGSTVGARVALPPGLLTSRFEHDGTRLMIVGRAELAPATLEVVTLVLGRDEIEQTIVVAGGSDVAIAATQPNMLLVASGGDLYTVDLTP